MVADALGELFPTIEVENVPIELLALMSTHVGWCSSALGPVVGEHNHHQLFNQPGSNTLLVVTQVGLRSDVGQFMRFSLAIGELPTLAGNERRRDTRAGVNAILVGQNRTDNSIVSGGLDFRVRMQGNVQQFITDPNGIAVVFPGTGLTISTADNNNTSMVDFMWRERAFQESELVPDG